MSPQLGQMPGSAAEALMRSFCAVVEFVNIMSQTAAGRDYPGAGIPNSPWPGSQGPCLQQHQTPGAQKPEPPSVPCLRPGDSTQTAWV